MTGQPEEDKRDFHRAVEETQEQSSTTDEHEPEERSENESERR